MPGCRDYPPIATEAPAVQPTQRPPRRDEEFRAALDRYMACYAEQQKHHTGSVERSGTRRIVSAWLEFLLLFRVPSGETWPPDS